MTYEMKKLEMDFGVETRTRRWEYRGFIILAKHYLCSPKQVVWSVERPDGSDYYAKTRTNAIATIDRQLGE